MLNSFSLASMDKLYLPILTHYLGSILMDLRMAKLIKLAKMAGVMHEADHAYSIRSTW